jgi:hypothetical protein
MARRRTWLIVCLAVTSAVGLIVAAGWYYTRMFPDPTENSRAYADRIRIAGGYVDISRSDGGDDSCNCVQRWYLGPAGADPATVFSGPGLTWEPLPAPGRTHAHGWEPLAAADVTTSDIGSCSADVARDTPPDPDSLRDYVMMSADQAEAWHERRLGVLVLMIRCQRDEGRL